MNPTHWNYVVVGQGLAGSVLAWQLKDRDQSVLIVDRGEADTSSKVAAGLITPITGKRISLSWNIEQLLGPSREFFRNIEKRNGRPLLRDLPHLRLFEDEEERAHWKKRAHWPEFQPFLHHKTADAFLPPGVDASSGGLTLRDSGYLDVPGFVEATKCEFEKDGAFREEEFDEMMLKFPGDEDPGGKVGWHDITADVFVFCQGFASAQSRFFDWLPYRSAKGEVLDLEIPSLDVACILNRGAWLLPMGGGRFRAGSTYSWDPLDQMPTIEGRNSILERVGKLISDETTVIGHRAGVRPIVDGFNCVIGRHPSRPQIAIFNGLGSKGVIKAPWFAKQLVDHLVDGRPIDNAFDVRRNI